MVAGIFVGLAYFLYRWEKIEKTPVPQEFSKEKGKEIKS